MGIEVQHIYKSFGGQRVLEDVSLSIRPVQSVGIVGNNGSGNTVLMKCICGFLRPDSGKIYVQGKQIGKEIDFPENMGVIIETPGFLPNMTGYQNLRLLASLQGKIGKQEIIHTLQMVGLDPNLRKPVSKYSLGMRQRLGIAQAIMEDPEALILDEPFNGLDKAGVSHIRSLILELKKRGKAILLASHNAMDIYMLCDEVHEMGR